MARREDIDQRFAFDGGLHLDCIAEHQSVHEGCRLLAHGLNDTLPEGREKSLVLTSLEQAMFWADAALHRRTAVSD